MIDPHPSILRDLREFMQISDKGSRRAGQHIYLKIKFGKGTLTKGERRKLIKLAEDEYRESP